MGGHLATVNSWVFHDGMWTQGNPPLMGPMHHAFWLSSIVFDGARAFEGCTPDLDLHSARVIRSARAMGLAPQVTAQQIQDTILTGVKKFAPGAELYLRPMFWGALNGGALQADPSSTRFVVAVYENPMPGIDAGSATLSPFRKPTANSAMTDAKAPCLYPNGARAVQDAVDRGFNNAVMLDQNGNVAEFATSNIFIVKDGIVHTPAVTGTFLNGITRQRTIALMRTSGLTVLERTIRVEELDTADEIVSTGNFGKVQAYTRYEGRTLPIGPVCLAARAAYWKFATDNWKI